MNDSRTSRRSDPGTVIPLTRRRWFRLAGAGAASAIASGCASSGREIALNDSRRRIAKLIGEFEAQGFHRTATAVDEESGRWLADQVQKAGLTATLEPFPVNRVDLRNCACTIANRRIEGIPLFDGDFTSANGIQGRLGAVGSDAEIGLAETAVNRAAKGALGEARLANRHRAIIAVTQGRTPGLCPCNADKFLKPFGPAVLQVSSKEGKWLANQASLGSPAHVVAHAVRTQATGYNVTTELRGTDSTLAPLVILTPRSGWFACGGERGAGIVCWLEIIRGLARSPMHRSVLFVASSGHELHHLGIDAFIARRAGIVKNARAWLNLGANIGAATNPTAVALQTPDDELDKAITAALMAEGIIVAERKPRTSVPSGEAESVRLGGGLYASVMCGNLLFHHIDDRGPKATSPEAVERFSRAFIAVTRSLAHTA
jgi:hypothetical protein